MRRMKKPPRHRPLIRCGTPSCPRFGTGPKHWGGRRFNLIETLPRSLADRSPRAGDERFETLTARRPQWTARVCPAGRRPGGCPGRARRRSRLSLLSTPDHRIGTYLGQPDGRSVASDHSLPSAHSLYRRRRRSVPERRLLPLRPGKEQSHNVKRSLTPPRHPGARGRRLPMASGGA